MPRNYSLYSGKGLMQQTMRCPTAGNDFHLSPITVSWPQSAIIKKMADVDFTKMHCGLKSFKKVN